jgi:hypothetical protein
MCPDCGRSRRIEKLLGILIGFYSSGFFRTSLMSSEYVLNSCSSDSTPFSGQKQHFPRESRRKKTAAREIFFGLMSGSQL